MNNARRKIIRQSVEKLREALKKLSEIKTAEDNVLASITDCAEFEDQKSAIEFISKNLEEAINSLELVINTLESEFID